MIWFGMVRVGRSVSKIRAFHTGDSRVITGRNHIVLTSFRTSAASMGMSALTPSAAIASAAGFDLFNATANSQKVGNRAAGSRVAGSPTIAPGAGAAAGLTELPAVATGTPSRANDQSTS